LAKGVLRNLPDLSKEFKVRTDASGDGIGCVLLQLDGSDEKLIECASKKFSETERRYPIIEQEAYAIMFALERWQHYLLGREFVIETDHRPLVWIQAKKDCRGKLGRWSLRLAEFNFKVNYVKGETNIDADSLSRAAVASVTRETLSRSQSVDEELRQLKLDGNVPLVEKDGIWFCVDGDKRRLYMPKELRDQMWTELHDKMGHLGQAKCRELLSSRFFWPKLRDDVKRWAKRCSVCATRKDFLPSPPPVPMVPVGVDDVLEPMQKVAVDVMGPFPEDQSGARYLIVSCDYLTRWCDAEPVTVTGGATMVNWLRSYSCRYGVPRELVLDRGPDMESREFKDYTASLGVKLTFIAPYHHQSNMVERCNRSLLNLLRTSLGEEKDCWVDKIPTVLLAYRTSCHSSLGVSPAKALYGRDLRLPVDVFLPTDLSHPKGLDQLQHRLGEVRKMVRRKQDQAAAARSRSYDAKHGAVPRSFAVRDRVYWRNPSERKFDPVWIGPFVVVERESETNYVIQGDSPVKKVVHVNQLKPCHDQSPLAVLRGRGRPRRVPHP
jgi:hypothetical protein